MDTINTLQKKLMITETQQGKTADDSVEKTGQMSIFGVGFLLQRAYF